SLNGSNTLAVSGASLGLQTGFFGDALTALASGAASPNVYFALNPGSLAVTSGRAQASDIEASDRLGTFHTFATRSIMGLLPGAQINGLALFTTDQGPTAHAGDVALFPLSPFSPDTFTTSGLPYAPGVRQQLSPGDILMTRFDGSFTLFATAGDLG